MPSTAHANPIMAYSFPFHQQPTPSNRKYLHLETKSCLSENCPFRILPQRSKLGWVPNSVCNKCSCPVWELAGQSLWFSACPTTNVWLWVSSRLPFTVDQDKTGLALNHSSREPDSKLGMWLGVIVGTVLTSPFSLLSQSLCWLSLAFIIDWRVGLHYISIPLLPLISIGPPFRELFP